MRKALTFAAALSVVMVVASQSAFAAARTSASPPTVTVATSASGMGYTAKTLSAPAGTQFLLVFTNHTSKQHNVSLEQGELEYGATLTIGKGTTASIFTLKKGTYHFYSSVGNDENTGMSGTLIVK